MFAGLAASLSNVSKEMPEAHIWCLEALEIFLVGMGPIMGPIIGAWLCLLDICETKADLGQQLAHRRVAPSACDSAFLELLCVG